MLYRKSSITIEDHLKSGINVGDRLFAETKTVEDFYLQLYSRGVARLLLAVSISRYSLKNSEKYDMLIKIVAFR